MLVKKKFWIGCGNFPPKKTTTPKGVEINFPIEDALESQACIQLKSDYCVPKRCLHCAFGHNLLNL